jgi:hypothetical protein
VASAEPALELLELVATAAEELGIQTAVIGAVAMAAHNYVRGTLDADLGTFVDPYTELGRLRDVLATRGLRVRLIRPDDQDPLGGVLRVWAHEDEDGDPIDYVEVVNFKNPHRPGLGSPGFDAIRDAIVIAAKPHLRYVRLGHLIALKLYAGGRRDQADVAELLRANPDADRSELLAVAKRFELDGDLAKLIDEVDGPRGT